jgi:hypothetical protein
MELVLQTSEGESIVVNSSEDPFPEYPLTPTNWPYYNRYLSMNGKTLPRFDYLNLELYFNSNDLETFKKHKEIREKWIFQTVYSYWKLWNLPALSNDGKIFLNKLGKYSGDYNRYLEKRVFWIQIYKRTTGHLNYARDYCDFVGQLPTTSGDLLSKKKLNIEILTDAQELISNQIFFNEFNLACHMTDLYFDSLDLGPPAYRPRKTVATISSREAPVFDLAKELRPDPVVMKYIKDNYPGSPLTQDD